MENLSEGIFVEINIYRVIGMVPVTCPSLHAQRVSPDWRFYDPTLLKFTSELSVRFKKIYAWLFMHEHAIFVDVDIPLSISRLLPGFKLVNRYVLFWRDMKFLIIFESGTNLAHLTGNSSNNLRSNRYPVTNPIDNTSLSTSFFTNVPVDVLNRPFVANRGCPPFDSHLSFRSCEEISTEAVACVSH